MFQKKFQEEDQKQQARVGGPEGADIAIEVSPQNPENSGESFKAPENAGERSKDQGLERKDVSKKQQQQQKQKKKKRMFGEGQWTPKVFGYKVHPKISNNLHKIKSMKSKSDPSTGLGCLYILLDRMLRMQN